VAVGEGRREEKKGKKQVDHTEKHELPKKMRNDAEERKINPQRNAEHLDDLSLVQFSVNAEHWDKTI